MVTHTKVTKMSGQDLLSHQLGKLKLGIVEVGWGSNETYATGGMNINESVRKLGITTVSGLTGVGTVGLEGYSVVYAYISNTHKIKIYSAADTEMANGTSLAGKKVKLLIIGY